MHVVVVGCGRVGSGLATTLEAQGHSVAIIDKRATAFRRLPADFEGRQLVGIGFDRDLLVQAGIERADALAAVTNGDNSNIVVARVAREHYGVERVVARIYDPRRAAIYERVGIPTVATVRWTAERVLRRILSDAPSVEWIDPSARVSLLERLVPTPWAGRRLSELESDGDWRIAAITRLGESLIPTATLVAQEGDVIWMMVDGDKLDELDRHLAAGPAKGGH
ncbi:MAG: TrkA family potassium uptake protein [Acidimicrobiales bacterium]|nr:TrkA family potassium uptake protein [Acidimicrobiales bacterium]